MILLQQFGKHVKDLAGICKTYICCLLVVGGLENMDIKGLICCYTVSIGLGGRGVDHNITAYFVYIKSITCFDILDAFCLGWGRY